MAESPDDGLFGPGSVAWRIHREPVTLVGGLRALLYQALHPVAMAAVAQHSDFRSDPWARFRRTSDYLMVTIFGTSDQAEEAASRVRRVHRQVRGVDPVTGRSYRADDADLLLWVHAVEVDSFLSAFRRYGGSLSASEADRYVAEMVEAGALLGLHRAEIPGDLGGLRDYLEGMDEHLCLTPAARAGMRVVVSPPMPAAARPLWALPSAAAVALLPDRIRRLYGFAPLALVEPALRISTSALFKTMRTLLPPPPPIQAALSRAAAA